MKCRSWCSAIFETSCTRYTTFPKETHQSSTSVQPTSKVPKPQSDKLPILLEIHNMFARRRRGEEPLLKNTTFSLKVCFLLRSSFLDRIEDGMRHERGPCVSNGKGIHDWEDIVLIDKSEMGLSTDIFIRKYCYKITHYRKLWEHNHRFWRYEKICLLATFFDSSNLNWPILFMFLQIFLKKNPMCFNILKDMSLLCFYNWPISSSKLQPS